MEIQAVIEDPRGSTVRHHRDPETGTWVAKPHPHTMQPWPANYGFIPETWNPADEDDLDILVLSSGGLETGQTVTVRVVGLLRRPDGDDKVLGVLAGDDQFGTVHRLEDVPGFEIDAIEDWFAAWSDVGTWHDANVAEARIRQARAVG